jgi:hypothetical protein
MELIEPTRPLYPAPRWALPRRRLGSLVVGAVALLGSGFLFGVMTMLAVA